MLILCFLDSSDLKKCKSAKNRKLKICSITKVPHTWYDGELKIYDAYVFVFLTPFYSHFFFMQNKDNKVKRERDREREREKTLVFGYCGKCIYIKKRIFES